MKTSLPSLPSSGTRLLESVENTTQRPSPEICDWVHQPPAFSAPVELTLTRRVSPVMRWCTKTARPPRSVSGGSTRLGASLSNATYRPSAERDGAQEPAVPCTPSVETL